MTNRLLNIKGGNFKIFTCNYRLGIRSFELKKKKTHSQNNETERSVQDVYFENEVSFYGEEKKLLRGVEENIKTLTAAKYDIPARAN